MARLHSRIYLHFLGVLVVAGLVGSLVFAVGARGTFGREVAERMVRHVASLAGERFGDRAALADRLRQLHADLDIDVVVRDLDGRVVAAAGRALPPLSDRQAATVRAGTVVVDSHPTWRAAAPVRDPQTRAIVGTLEGATPRRFGGPRLLWPVLAVTAILLVVAAATRPLARRISRPLERLTEAARRLGQGDLAVRAPDPRAPSPRWWTRRFSPGVDELRELTRSFNDMADRVERLVRGQRELLANVSHALRSPLARLNVALGLARQRNGQATPEHLDRIETEAERLNKLIGQLLTMARVDSGVDLERPTRFDLGSVVEEVSSDAEYEARDRHCAVAFDQRGACVVEGAREMLRGAVENVVRNAVRHTAERTRVEVSLDRRQAPGGSRAVIRVRDHGPGVPQTAVDSLFVPFTQVLTGGVSNPERSGLGLAITRRTFEVHGGSATAANAPDGGFIVTLELPLPA
jgi:signal transduction histidine kinase